MNIVEINDQTILHDSPRVFTIDKFITDEECQHMITISKPIMKDSLVSYTTTGGKSSGRTSKNAWIQHNHDEITQRVGEKIAKVIGMPLENAEAFQVIYYNVGGEYRRHYDSWDHNGSEKTSRCMKYGGARIKTALVYLNDVEEGGSTCLNRIDTDVKADKGKLLVFENTYSDSNVKHPLSEHAGMPVIKGEKYAFNLWFKECHSKKLYSDFNPDYYKSTNGTSDDNNNASNEDTNKSDIVEEIQINQQNNIISDYKYNSVLKLSSSFTREYGGKNIYTTPQFVFNSECEKIINHCDFNNSSSQKYANCWIKKDEFPEFIQKIEEYTNISSDYFENLNIFKYIPGQHHGPFTDAYNLDTENGKKCTSKLGQRIFTVSLSLNNELEYSFSKIGKNIHVPKGTLLLYDNITRESINIKDMNLERTIKNNSETDSYVLNIHIREKDTKGNRMMAIPDHIFENITNNIGIKTTDNSTVNVSKEDYMKTYEDVLSMFKNNSINASWRGHNSLKYLFKGDFVYFKECVSKYIDSRVNSGSGNALNMTLLEKPHTFDEYHPIVLDNTILPETLSILQEYYKTTIDKGVFILGDKQSKRFKAHNEPMSRLLHYEMLPLIEHIVGKSLEPTYTYLSCYVKDSDLPAHTDRADCEYTVSYIINKPTNENWPIYFHTKKQPTKHKGRLDFTPPKDECIECDCGPGGLMMFNGTDHAHFREKLEGEYYHIVLLHYRSV
jgi:prolyl 4-hydroxylase